MANKIPLCLYTGKVKELQAGDGITANNITAGTFGSGDYSFSGLVTNTRDNIGTTPTDAFLLVNNTAAAAGAQQFSPAINFKGQGWKTNATAASQAVNMRIHLVPVQGAAAPTGNLVIQSSIDGGAYTDQAWFTSGGSLRLGAGPTISIASGSLTLQATSDLIIGVGTNRFLTFNATNAIINWTGQTRIYNDGDGSLSLRDNAGTAFTSLALGGTSSSYPSIRRNAAALEFKLADNSAFANISAANGTFSGTVTVGNLYTATTSSNANFAAFGSTGAAVTAATLMVGGASQTVARIIERGSTNPTLSANDAYASHIIGTQTVTEAATGTHPLMVQLAIKALSATNGAGATADAATLYIEGAMTGVTPTGGNYSLWVDAGDTRLDGALSAAGVVTLSNYANGFLQVNGSGVVSVGTPAGSGYTIVSVTTTTSSPAQTSGDIILLVDAATAGGNVTVNLPTAVGNTAKFTIKKIDSGANTVTVDGNTTETIDGATTQVINFQNTSITIVSDNVNWFKI